MDAYDSVKAYLGLAIVVLLAFSGGFLVGRWPHSPEFGTQPASSIVSQASLDESAESKRQLGTRNIERIGDSDNARAPAETALAVERPSDSPHYTSSEGQHAQANASDDHLLTVELAQRLIADAVMQQRWGPQDENALWRLLSTLPQDQAISVVQEYVQAINDQQLVFETETPES